MMSVAKLKLLCHRSHVPVTPSSIISATLPLVMPILGSSKVIVPRVGYGRRQLQTTWYCIMQLHNLPCDIQSVSFYFSEC